jgi:hypothetical protein
MALEHVQPGDLITSQLINDIIDALGKLDAKITKCCEGKDTTPTSPPQTSPPQTPPPDGQKPNPVIERVVPGDASPNDTVTIHGRGFGSKSSGLQVSIAGKAAKVGNVTDTSIDVVVPTLGFRERAKVDVVVTLDDRFEARGTMTVGPASGTRKTGIALVKVGPEGKLVAGRKYRLTFSVTSTGKDNLTAIASAIGANGKKAALVSTEFSFVSQPTQTLEAVYPMPKAGGVVEVDLVKGSSELVRAGELVVVTSQSYTFVVGEDPPLDVPA